MASFASVANQSSVASVAGVASDTSVGDTPSVARGGRLGRPGKRQTAHAHCPEALAHRAPGVERGRCQRAARASSGATRRSRAPRRGQTNAPFGAGTRTCCRAPVASRRKGGAPPSAKTWRGTQQTAVAIATPRTEGAYPAKNDALLASFALQGKGPLPGTPSHPPLCLCFRLS